MQWKRRLIGGDCPMTFIIGQNPPNRQRNGQQNFQVFHGTRSGDLVEEVIEGCESLLLTNICMHQSMSEKNIMHGIGLLKMYIETLKPARVILLGEWAAEKFDKFLLEKLPADAEVYYLSHPSYVLRFQKDVSNYKKLFKQLLIFNQKSPDMATEKKAAAPKKAATEKKAATKKIAAAKPQAEKKAAAPKKEKVDPYADMKRDDLIKACKERGIYEKEWNVDTMREMLKISISAHIRRLTEKGMKPGEIDKQLGLKPAHSSIILSRDRRVAKNGAETEKPASKPKKKTVDPGDAAPQSDKPATEKPSAPKGGAYAPQTEEE